MKLCIVVNHIEIHLRDAPVITQSQGRQIVGAAFDYRQLAEDERRAANATPLIMVRFKHIAAAEKWEALAKDAERHEPR